MRLTTSLTYILLLLSMVNGDFVLFQDQLHIFIQKVASRYHENWRRHYISEHPFTRNRFKLTQHGSHYNSSDFIYPMILTVGSCLVHRNLKVACARYNSSITYVDILNMAYDELPDDWTYENRATAQIACREVLQGVREKRLFDRNFIEQVAENIHQAWIERNAHRIPKESLLPYAKLSEGEKDKDRRALSIACRLFNELHFYRYFQITPIQLIGPPIE